MKRIFSVMFIIVLTIFTVTTIEASMLNQEDEFNNIVIFIKFADEDNYTAPYDLQHYENLFNASNQVSLKDYYLEVTYNQLSINSILLSDNNQIIWYQDIHNRSYYEEFDFETNPNGVKEDEQDQREHNLLKRAIDFVDNENLIPDNTMLDSNDDGTIDSITFMVSGEDNGWNSLLWPHMWTLYTFQDSDYDFIYNAPTINGVNALDYTFELLGNTQNYSDQVQVGVLAHETFHLLSAPDLYHYYDYTYITPVGDWGLMDGTTDIPSHMLGYMKYKYGNWIDSIESITKSGSYTLYPLQDSADNIYKIATEYPNEYIYMEYRDQSGLYENSLPDSGLLIYRVNSSLNGNESGSYDSIGNPSDEIWIYRPNMDDDIFPIELKDTDYYIDGDIDKAALSNNNQYDSAGSNQEIKLFSGEGDSINIRISNVIEYDGYITFDVVLPPSITLNTKTDIPSDTIFLLDDSSMNYTVNVNNIPSNAEAYYTLDGTTPTKEDTLLTTDTITISAATNIVTVAYYIEDELTNTLQEEYTFKSTIESDHSPYGNELTTYWYLDFGIDSQIEIIMDHRSFLEDQYDYLYVSDGSNTLSYTGDELTNIQKDYNTNFLLLHLSTDEYIDNDFGFKIELEVQSNTYFELLGPSKVTSPINSPYADPGILITGDDKDLFTYQTINGVDSSIIGNYQITYNILNLDGEIIKTIYRSVEIVDEEPPMVMLNGDSVIYVELGSVYNDLGVTASDNVDNNLTITTSSIIDTNHLGTTIITYTVTDSSFNESMIERTIIVQDSIKAELSLEPGIDTITVNQGWIDSGIHIKDHSDTTESVLSHVENSIPGEYKVIYEVTDEGGNISTITRYVTVIEDIADKTITCDPFVSTVETKKPLDIGKCYLDGQEMILDQSSIDYNFVGQYSVLYSYEDQGVTYQKTQYIYVVATYESPVLYIERKRYL